MKNKGIYIVFLLATLSSCEFFKIKEAKTVTGNERQPIARAHEVYLYPEDLEGIAPEGMPKEDSIDRVKRYIDNWAKKQILIKVASENIDFDEADIERKILDYRYSLMGYEYQSYYINKHLNKEVTNEQIVQYYEKNIDNFILKQNIIRGRFVSLPNEAPKTENIKALLISSTEEDYEKLMAYCLSFARAYQINDSLWMNLDEVTRGTPWAEKIDDVDLTATTGYLQVEDSLTTFHINIMELKTSGEISPVDFVNEQIRDIIINKRKVELARKLELEVYTKAKENNEIEIYEK